MSRNMMIAIAAAILIVLALFLFLQPRGGNEAGGQPPHETTGG